MIRLIPATFSDLDFVFACITELEQTAFDKDEFSLVYDQLLRSGICFSFLIASNNENIGYMSLHIQPLLHHCGQVAEIQELVVLPEYRSGGVGRAAIEFAKTFAKEKGCVLLELATNLKREDAHRFYSANGFNSTHYKFTMDL